ncbi:LOW QUALITY PROTEIN: hypothetical protein PHMEG_00034077 [Phytophthora megakarya]|uniref:Uncharacterized protein n=1 Tax=Phytophthora megakarya TaxID=4795 RepID=A0A225US43_9STRA|nr:LOW QUALITY PROTEIN: hypothetical protein PHMEG_00034077 [Phytophthora megakarya]
MFRSHAQSQRNHKKGLAVARRIAADQSLKECKIQYVKPLGYGCKWDKTTGEAVKRPKDLYELWGEYEFGLGGGLKALERLHHGRAPC